MAAFREHLVHHTRHMIACGVAALVMIIGFALSVSALAVVGAVACGAMCFSMIRMMVIAGRSR